MEKEVDINKNIATGIHTRATFLMAIPTLGTVPIEFMVAFSRMQFPVNCRAESFIIKGMEVGVARNYAVERYLAMSPRPEYLLFIGDDMLPPWNSLLMLYEEMKSSKWDILSGLYYMKAPNTLPIPVMWRDEIKGLMKDGEHFNTNEVIRVDVAGMDFTLIKGDVFDKLGKAPWFKTADSLDMVNEKGCITVFTEDVYFCKKVKEAGLKIGVHTGVRCGHLLSSGEVF